MDDLVKVVDTLDIDDNSKKILKDFLSKDCKKSDTDKELKDDCNCANSSLGDKDPCLENWENRFKIMANNGDFTGITFDGQNLIPCTELDIIFNCTMITERIKDALISGTANFVRNQIGNSSSTASRIWNIFSGAISIG